MGERSVGHRKVDWKDTFRTQPRDITGGASHRTQVVTLSIQTEYSECGYEWSTTERTWAVHRA